MQTRISHLLFVCLTILAWSVMPVKAQSPDFPPDPGEVYVPPVVIIMGDTIDMSDTTQVLPTEIDLLEDGTIVYNTEENSLTLNNASLVEGEVEGTAISYSGSDTLTIILQDTSRIYADTIINSQSNVTITGDGKLEAVGTVPIIGVPEASITFGPVYMHVQSVPNAAALQRFIRGQRRIKEVDETGGPALSGFGSADFGKVNVTPSDGMYGPLAGSGGGEEEEDEMYALYVLNEDGEQEVVTEFETTPKDEEDALSSTKTNHELDYSAPMYNILGLPVDAGYKGIVLQGGRKYILK